LDDLKHQKRLATKTSSALARLLDAVRLTLTADVVVEICDERATTLM